MATLFYASDRALLYNADCAKECPIEKESIDALVTDPPAGISFMGNKWDKSGSSREAWVQWAESCFSNAYGALKPGAYGLVWALPRRSHWTSWALESAGFEILDIVHHFFGKAWPKNRDLSVALDEELGVVRPVIGVKVITYDGAKRDPSKHTSPAASASFGKWGMIKSPHGLPLTAPVTEQAKQWDGWGTALKPAVEHWILIRKPISEKTLAKNLLKHGVGGMNIKGARLPSGRWPANLIHDGQVMEEHYALFFYAAKPGKKERSLGCSSPNRHPTVKPAALMDYLVKLITPAEGIVLDIFAGSATTGVSALRNGFGFVGFENNAEYLVTAKERLAFALISMKKT